LAGGVDGKRPDLRGAALETSLPPNQLGRGEVIPNGKFYEIGIVFSMKQFHHPILVKTLLSWDEC